MAGRDEQETQVTQGRLDEYVEVWTNNVVDVRTLEKESRATRAGSAKDLDDKQLAQWLEDGFGVCYRISTEDFHPLKGFRRKRAPMTDEQKAAVTARLAAGRKS